MKLQRRRHLWWQHGLLLLAVLLIVFPIYMAIVASSHSMSALLQAPIPLLPGNHLFENYYTVFTQGIAAVGGLPVWRLLLNSFFMAVIIAIGKIAVSLLSAYAIVFFRFPLRMLCFWLIFLTLMLPVEVRIVPTFEVTARLALLNTFSGLTLPLIASATATFLFRQFFLTIPNELVEAAKLDGAGPFRFFYDVVIPVSRTNIAALFIIMFIYGWNQYLWPLVITTDASMQTVVMGIQQLASAADQLPQWHLIMAIAVLAMLPPLLVVLVMQRLFTKGLLESDK